MEGEVAREILLSEAGCLVTDNTYTEVGGGGGGVEG